MLPSLRRHTAARITAAISPAKRSLSTVAAPCFTVSRTQHTLATAATKRTSQTLRRHVSTSISSNATRSLQNKRVLSQQMSTTPQQPQKHIPYQSVVITLAGPDRSGIVHELSKTLQDLRGNIEESRMTILGNDFAVILLSSLPASIEPDTLREQIKQQFPGFVVSARHTERDVAAAYPTEPVRILRMQVQGPDQPGVVRGLTELLYKYGISIRDLDTDTSSAPFAGYKIFSLKGIIAVPTSAQPEDIQNGIDEFEQKFGFEVELSDPNEEVDENEDAEEEAEDAEEAYEAPTQQPQRRVGQSSAQRTPTMQERIAAAAAARDRSRR